MAVIELEGLSKDYRRLRGGRVAALDGLDLTVAAGGVFGFLGPNGSGKTTTIRCLLGLARPTSGRCRVLAPIRVQTWPESSGGSARSSRRPGYSRACPDGGTWRSWAA